MAAFAVVVVHAPGLMGPLQAPSAGMAVDLFFVMSGFIIAHAYEDKLRSSMSAWRFMVLRLVRLYPLYALGLLLGIAQALVSMRLGSSGAWTFDRLLEATAWNAAMLPVLRDGPVFPLNPPGWSLFFELVINIAYVAVLPWLSTRILAVFVAVAAAALVVLGIGAGDLHFGSHAHNFFGGFARVAYSFPIGVLLYRLAPNGTLWKVPPLVILALAAGIFIVPLGAHTLVFELISLLVLLPLLTAMAAGVEPSRRLAPAFACLGLISYGVYSLHYPLVLFAQSIAKRMPDGLGGWLGLAFMIGLSVAVWLIDRTYDTPLRRWLQDVTSQQRPKSLRNER